MPTLIPLVVAAVFAAVALVLLRVDWTPGRYKVVYHLGPEVNLKTRMAAGWLTVENGRIEVTGDPGLSLPLARLRSVERFRLHGLGRMIRVTHDDGTLYLTVVRFNIAGRFATVDFFKTGKLADVLTAAAAGNASTGR